MRIKCVGCGRYGNLEYVADIIEAVPVVESAATADARWPIETATVIGNVLAVMGYHLTGPELMRVRDILERRASVHGEKE